MTTEKLREAIDIAQAIQQQERIAQELGKAKIGVINRYMLFVREEDINLTPEEEEALDALRQAYLTILHRAVDSKLTELKTLFEAI